MGFNSGFKVLNCFLEKGRDKVEEGHSDVRLHRGKRYGKKQSSEYIVTATVSWSILSLHVNA